MSNVSDATLKGFQGDGLQSFLHFLYIHLVYKYFVVTRRLCLYDFAIMAILCHLAFDNKQYTREE